MAPAEVRAIRGSLSQAAFAELLGVTKLTVLRWELPEDKKEARRPRGKQLAALRALADGAAQPDGDVDAPEPSLPSVAGFADDERRVLPLLERLYAEPWPHIEDELLALGGSNELASAPGRALASLGLAQIQLFGRFEVRAALTTLVTVLGQDDDPRWPRPVLARAHALAAVLFSATDSRVFDVGRCNFHAERAEALLDERERTLRALVAAARIGAARTVDPVLAASLERSYQSTLEGAASPTPLVQLVVAFLRGAPMEEWLAIAERLGLEAFAVMFLGLRARRSVREARKPSEILALARAARDRVRTARLAVSEPFIGVLAAEIEAYSRLGRLNDAARVADEAMALAKSAGVSRHALATVIARLYVHQARVAELATLAVELASDGGSNLHVVAVRAHLAGLEGSYDLSTELAEQVCRSHDAMTTQYLKHDAFIDLVYAKLLARDHAGAKLAVERTRAFLRTQPSVVHDAIATRLEGYVLMREGRFVEARQRLEATVGRFVALEDVVRAEHSRGTLALLAIATGAPDGQARLDTSIAELGRNIRVAPEVLARGKVLAVPFAGDFWHELTLLEKLAVAVERFAMRPNEADHPLVEMLTNVVGADLDAERRAVLRLAATAARLLARSDRVVAEPAALDVPGVVAASSAMRRLIQEIGRLSRSSATVLVTGESGSGKEVIARAVHDLSTRAKHPYVVFNCASVPRELFESQLFGHRRGSFTGAVTDSLGVIRAADGGTLFLDEIGELPLDVQPKLLRFLENAEVMPVGEQVPREVDVRIVAATHRDLARQVRDGAFREDLYYRLNVVPIRVPPLRERPDDIAALARFFVQRLVGEGKEPPILAEDAVQSLEKHTWPGNARELRNVIARTMAYSPVPATLHAEHLRIGS